MTRLEHIIKQAVENEIYSQISLKAHNFGTEMAMKFLSDPEAKALLDELMRKAITKTLASLSEDEDAIK